MKLKEKDMRILNGISQASAIFTLMVALTMIFGLVQLKVVKPLDSPYLASIKEQYDKDPSNREKAEQIRAMDLMARRAYFSSRWEIETGSYLLLAGAVIFILTRRIISSSEKPDPSFPLSRPDIISQKSKNRRYLIIAASMITIAAILSSIILRGSLPVPGSGNQAASAVVVVKNQEPAAVPVSAGVNFPFFRGEGSRGIAGGKGYPVEWNGSEGKNIKWKIPVPGKGKNSPVIWGKNIFITGINENALEVYCIDKLTGNIIWTGSASDFPGASNAVPESDAEAGMAVPTAAVNSDVVCAIFGNGNMVCFDHAGKRLWGKNIGVPKNTYGYSASLLIYEKTLIVQYDSDPALSIKGFDLATGDKKWDTPRTGRPVWSSPVIGIFDGKPQVVINGNPNVSGYDPVTGEELWSLPGVTGDVAPSPAVNSKYAYIETDYAKLIAVKPGKTGSAVWEDNTFTSDVSSPVADDQYLFLVTGSGDAVCYNAEKGDTVWNHIYDNPFYASPMIADGKIWMLDRKGIMHIAGYGPKFTSLGESQLGEESDCTPAFSEGRIYIRGKNNLYCISND